MAIGDYTHNIGAIEDDAKNQKADLKLSEAVSHDWTVADGRLSCRLGECPDKTNGLDKVPRERRQSEVRAGHGEQSGQSRHEHPAVSSRHWTTT